MCRGFTQRWRDADKQAILKYILGGRGGESGRARGRERRERARGEREGESPESESERARRERARRARGRHRWIRTKPVKLVCKGRWMLPKQCFLHSLV